MEAASIGGRKCFVAMSQEGTNYAGPHLRQLEDYSFEITMEEFIYTRLEPILGHKKALKKNAADTPLAESEKTQLRGLIASLNWVSREGRPNASSATSILASAFSFQTHHGACARCKRCGEAPEDVSGDFADPCDPRRPDAPDPDS